MSVLVTFFPEVKVRRFAIAERCPVESPIALRGLNSSDARRRDGTARESMIKEEQMMAQLKGEMAKRYAERLEVYDVLNGASLDGSQVYREVHVRTSGRSSAGNPLGEELTFERRLATMTRCFGTGMIFGMALLLIVQVALNHDVGSTTTPVSCRHTVQY